jgi:ribosomal protein L9
MEEVFLFTQHIKNFTYNDVMHMPTGYRRYFLGLKLRENTKQQEMMEKQREEQNNRGAKGTRSKKISGDALKVSMENGHIPLS